jgi:hypothetical protein
METEVLRVTRTARHNVRERDNIGSPGREPTTAPPNEGPRQGIKKGYWPHNTCVGLS